MEIREIKNKEIWEDFLSGCEEKTFLSSWNWGEFNEMMGSDSGGKIWRLGIYSDRDPVSVALVVKTVAKRGTFLLIPHGPNIKNSKSRAPNSKFQIINTLLEELKKIAKDEKVDFIRISPILERSEENIKIFKDLGFKSAPIHAHPEASWKLDIKPPEEELLAKMRKTTRYLIRQAEKNRAIEVFQNPAFAGAAAGRQKIEDVDIFNNLQKEIVKTQKFIPFSLKYLKNEFLVFQPDNQISLFFGRCAPSRQNFDSGDKGKIIASAFVLFWSKIGFYHHAALLPQYHKIPIAYLLQWEAIKEAKRRGCESYDFWGYVNPKREPKHPWAGPTLFKMGFGGRAFEYVKTQDFPLSKKYYLTRLFEKLRKNKRGL